MMRPGFYAFCVVGACFNFMAGCLLLAGAVSSITRASFGHALLWAAFASFAFWNARWIYRRRKRPWM